MDTLNEKLSFLRSPSFWSMFVGAIAIMLGPDGSPTMPEIYNGLLALSAGFTGIYTLNKNVKRIAEAKVEAAQSTNQEI